MKDQAILKSTCWFFASRTFEDAVGLALPGQPITGGTVNILPGDADFIGFSRVDVLT
jgi:hypothetical protein